MKEAKITCLCSQYTIPDLKRTMRKGESFWLPESEVLKSKDLVYAKHIGAVEIAWVQRYRQLRNPAPKQPPPAYVGGYKRPPTPVEPPPPAHALDVDLIRQVFSEEFSKFQASLMQEIKSLLKPAPLDFTLEDIKLALNSSRHISDQRPVNLIEEAEVSWETPIFIPSDLVPKTDSSGVNVESSSEDGNVGDALAALRSFKKK